MTWSLDGSTTAVRTGGVERGGLVLLDRTTLARLEANESGAYTGRYQRSTWRRFVAAAFDLTDRLLVAEQVRRANRRVDVGTGSVRDRQAFEYGGRPVFVLFEVVCSSVGTGAHRR